MRPACPISVITVCLNAEQYLPEAIESVLNQSFNQFEYILVDDCSTDHSPDIINNYAAKDCRIRVIVGPNRGQTAVRIAALQHAKGEWIANLDADDVAISDRLEKQFARARVDTGLSLIGSGCIEIAENGRPLREHSYPANHQQLKKRLLDMSPFFPHSSAFFRRKTALAVGGYRPRFTRSQDYDLWLRLQSVGKMACVQEPLVKLRRHKRSLTAQDGARLQTVMAVAALADYLHGEQIGKTHEPMTDDEWVAMLAWIDQALEERGWFQERRLREMVRKVRHANTFSNRASAVLDLLQNTPYACRVMLRRLQGYYVPRQVAQEAAARLSSGVPWPGKVKQMI